MARLRELGERKKWREEQGNEWMGWKQSGARVRRALLAVGAAKGAPRRARRRVGPAARDGFGRYRTKKKTESRKPPCKLLTITDRSSSIYKEALFCFFLKPAAVFELVEQPKHFQKL